MAILRSMLGDGLLVYFGYPQAHEDDAQRAVRAGLGMLEALEHLNTVWRRSKDMHSPSVSGYIRDWSWWGRWGAGATGTVGAR